MTPPQKTSVSLRDPGVSTASSKARTQFNTLVTKLEAQRKRLAEWHDAIPRMRARAETELKPIEENIMKRQRALAFLFDRAYEHKSFKKKEREKLSALIVDLTGSLMNDEADEALSALHKKHAAFEDDPDVTPTLEELDAIMMEMFGLEPDANPGPMGEEPDSHSAPDSARNPERKPSPKEARKEAEEQKLLQSVREIFRKLASLLHPDREPDPAERERKTALMQRANAAYAAKDLLGLLELQFEVEQIDQAALETLDDDRIKQYNKVLTRQVSDVRRDIEELEHWLVFVLGIAPRGKITPSMLDKILSEEKEKMLYGLGQLDHDIAQFQHMAVIKDFLRSYTIRHSPSIFDDGFY